MKTVYFGSNLIAEINDDGYQRAWYITLTTQMSLISFANTFADKYPSIRDVGTTLYRMKEVVYFSVELRSPMREKVVSVLSTAKEAINIRYSS